MYGQSLRQQQVFPADGLRSGPAFPDCQVIYIDTLHALIINNKTVRCTLNEYHIAVYLFDHYDQQVTFEEVIGLLDQTALDMPDLYAQAKKRMIKAMSILRMKLWHSGFCILSLSGVGYTLIRRSDVQPRKPDAV